MLTIGIDPDLHDLAIGYWQDGQPSGAYVVHVQKLKGRTGQLAVLDMVEAMQRAWPSAIHSNLHVAIAVEAQTLRRRGVKQHKRPEDIVVLGNVAGAALACCQLKDTRLFFPTPEAWKGQIPKSVMQARLYTDLGWEYEVVGKAYARPLNPPKAFFNITDSQWKHVGDALLLAKWAAEQVK